LSGLKGDLARQKDMERYEKKVLPALCLACLGLVAALSAFSCSSPPPGSPSGTQIFLYINNDTGCDVVATLDGGSPVTNTSNGGPYTLYTNVPTGQHTIGIAGPLNPNGACNYDVTGANHTITVNNPCQAVNGTSGYILYCN